MALDELVYVYGICQLPEVLPSLPLGLQGEIDLVAVEDIAAIVEPGIELEGIQAENPRLLTAVLSHDRVICELFHQQMTILPMRFGTQLASFDKLKEHIASHYQSYRFKLSSLTNKAEYQIKFSLVSITLPPLPDGLKGRDYFLAKKQRLQNQSAQQEIQQNELYALLSEIRSNYADCVEVSQPNGDSKVYLLLDRTNANSLKQQAEHWQKQASHWEISLSEALPPYHFV